MKYTYVIGALIIATIILAGCPLQPEIQDTGAVVVSLAPSSSVTAQSVVEREAIGYVRLYLMNGNKYYRSDTQEFVEEPWSFQISVSGSDSTVVEIAGLPPGDKYQVLGALGERTENGFLRTHMFSYYGPFAVSVGNRSEANLRDNQQESGFNYADNVTTEIDSVVTVPTDGISGVAGTWALVDGSLYRVADGMTGPELTSVSIVGASAGFVANSLSIGREPVNGKQTLWLNGDTSTGIYHVESAAGDEVTVRSLGSVEASTPVPITESAAYRYDETSGDLIVAYRSTDGLGVANWDSDYDAPDEWFDIAEEAGDDLPDSVDLATAIQDYTFREGQYAVVSTSEFGTVFLSEKTLDDIVESGDTDERFLGNWEDSDGVLHYYLVDKDRFLGATFTVTTKDGEETFSDAVRIGTNPLNIIDTFPSDDYVPVEYRGQVVLPYLKAIPVPDGSRVRALGGSDEALLLGTDVGLYYIGVETKTDGTGNEYASLKTTADGGLAISAVAGALQRRVQLISVNDAGTRAAVLYNNGTVDVVSLGTTAQVVTTRRRPFYSGLPGSTEIVSGMVRSTVTDIAWQSDTAMVVSGEYGLVIYETE